ncbi:hypothetical protein D3C80_1134880 [compost metagenome]
MQTDVAARRTIGVRVGEAEARRQVQGLQNGLASTLGGDEFLVDGVAGLGDRFSNRQAFDVAGAALSGDDDVADFRRFRAGRLGRGGAGHEKAAHQGGRRPEQLFAVSHLSVSPMMKA